MLLEEPTIWKAGLIAVVAVLLPALFFKTIFVWSGRMARARVSKEPSIENFPIVSVKVAEVTPRAIVRRTDRANANKSNPYATAPKLELHHGSKPAAEEESQMTGLKGARIFITKGRNPKPFEAAGSRSE